MKLLLKILSVILLLCALPFILGFGATLFTYLGAVAAAILITIIVLIAGLVPVLATGLAVVFVLWLLYKTVDR